MKKLIIFLLVLVSIATQAQQTDATLLSTVNTNIRLQPATKGITREVMASILDDIIKSNPNLLSTYSNPNWILDLPYSKLTNIPISSSSLTGVLSASDWILFNSKISGITSGNGTTANGTAVDLGDATMTPFDLIIPDNAITGTAALGMSNGSVYMQQYKVSNAAIHSDVYVQNDGNAHMESTNGAEIFGLQSQADNKRFIFTDGRTDTKGIEYNADYSGGFKTHSLVDSLFVANAIIAAGGGYGTVTDVSVTTADGVSGIVTTSTTTPAITLTLGAITPASVAASGTVIGSNLSGTNTGDAATNSTSNTYADSKVADAINDGTTTIAPSQNAVFDALVLKTDKLFSQRTITGVDAIIQADNTKILYFNSASPFNFTIDALTTGTNATLINIGAGTVTFINGVGVTISGTTSIASGYTASILYDASTTPDIISGAGAGSGTVTSVGFTGGLISVANATTIPALTVAGTSGGIPYFSSSSVWASSAALTVNAIVIGGGAGVAPSTTTTGTGVLTALGVNVGSAGAFTTFDGAHGTPSSLTGTNITGTATGLTSGVTNALKSATTTVDVSAATAPTSGQVLTATAGTTATWQTPSTGWALTGNSNVTTPTITGVPSFIGNANVYTDNLVVTPIAASGLTIENRTAAVVGTQVQISPPLVFKSAAYVTGGGTSQTNDYQIYSAPAAGTSNTTSTLVFRNQVGSAGYTVPMQLNTNGATATLTVGSTNGTVSITGAGATLVTQNVNCSNSNLAFGAILPSGSGTTIGQSTTTSGAIGSINYTARRYLGGSYSFGSGTGTYIANGSYPTLNTLSTYTGVFINDDFNPTLTSTIGLTILAYRSIAGSHLLGGATVTSNTRLDVRGLGTTTDLIGRFASSADTERFAVESNGEVRFNGAGGTSGNVLISAGANSSPTWSGNFVGSTYTPTLTNVANLDASTAYECTYMRVGSTVTVSGRVDIDPTTTLTSTQLGISLPVASALTTANQAGGTAAATAISGQSAAIRSDATNDRAELIYTTTDITNQPMYFTFTYQVL